MFIELTDEAGCKMIIRIVDINAVKHDEGHTAVYALGAVFKVLEDYGTVCQMVNPR
jgi:hypothetical protein